MKTISISNCLKLIFISITPMKSKVNKNFSYTLDGYMEAKEYLQQKGKQSDVHQNHLTGIKLVEEANKLLKEERNSSRLLTSIKYHSALIFKFLRRKIAYKVHAVSGFLCISVLYS